MIACILKNTYGGQAQAARGSEVKMSEDRINAIK